MLPETSVSHSTILATPYRDPLPMGPLPFCPLQIYHGSFILPSHQGDPYCLQPFQKANPQSSPYPCLQLVGSHCTEENVCITGCLCNWFPLLPSTKSLAHSSIKHPTSLTAPKAEELNQKSLEQRSGCRSCSTVLIYESVQPTNVL